MTARGVFHKTDSASYGGCGRVHLHIYDGRWMENGQPDFVLCICARRGPCALDTIPRKRTQVATGALLSCRPTLFYFILARGVQGLSGAST
jgi:hypothetical protein